MIDAQAVHRFRRERGISHAELASRAGIGISRLRLLWQGTQKNVTTLRDLSRVAGVLGVHPGSLLLASESRQLAPSPDDLKLESALATVGKRVRSKDLCDTFGWTLPRLQRATQRLQVRLERGAMRVDVSPQGLVLHVRPDGLTVDESQRLLRSTFPKTGVRIAEVQAVRMLADGAVTTAGLEQHATFRKALSQLERLGYVVAQPDGQVTLSEDVLRGISAAGIKPERALEPAQSATRARERYVAG